MSNLGFTGVRKAIIHNVNNNGTYDIYYLDEDVNNVIKGVGSTNLGSFGSGIFFKYQTGSIVSVAQGYYYEPTIIGNIAPTGSIEQGQILEANEIDKPIIDPGEIVLQAQSGAHIDLRKTGDIKVANLNDDNIFISDSHRSILINANQNYTINESGFTIEGRIRRFHPNYLPGRDPVFNDLLKDIEADSFTFDVSRDPTQHALPINRDRGTATIIRNPAFAEKREVILEFADSFFVRDAQTETDIATEFPKTIKEMNKNIPHRRGYGEGEQKFDDLRHSSRTNVLKLDNNVIIERVQGTLVDIFGNILDINYNKLQMPKLLEKGKDAIPEAHQLLNRSVAYHFQINSRNLFTSSSTGSSKFTLDVDKEGQFKLNVPRSSSFGTIATVSSFTSADSDINSRIDINNTSLSKSNIISPTGGNVGTAFHDMSIVADRLIRYTLQTINPIRVHNNTIGIQALGDTPNIEFLTNQSTTPQDIPQYTTTISVENGDSAIASEINSNMVGGRSGLMNFEGSIEISVGKDDIDEKSIMLDTAGSLVAWLGSDRHGRSAVVNTDGAVLLNIGDYITDENGNENFNQGTLALRVNLADENDVGQLQPNQIADNKTTSDHIVYIGPRGIVISCGSGTPMVFRSSGDMLFEAAGAIDMKGKEIRLDAGFLRKVKPSKGDI